MKEEGKTITYERSFWVIVSILFAIICSFAGYFANVTSSRLNKIEERQEKMENCISEIKTSNAVIISKIDDIKPTK